jgi:hypothetical protein
MDVHPRFFPREEKETIAIFSKYSWTHKGILKYGASSTSYCICIIAALGSIDKPHSLKSWELRELGKK